MRKRNGFVATLTVLAVLLGVFVNSASARLWTLTNGLDNVKIEDSVIVNATTGLSESLGVSYWTMNSSTLDRLYQQGFWYAVGYTAPRALASLPVTSTKTYASTAFTTPIDLTYTSAGEFKVTTTYTLTGATTSNKTSKLSKVVTITNLTAAPLEFHLYHYSDYDVRYTPASRNTSQVDYDAAAVRGGKAFQTGLIETSANSGIWNPDGVTVVQTSNPPASITGTDSYGGYTYLLEDPTNTAPLDIDGTFVGPTIDYNSYLITPEDSQFVMQYDLNIAANGSVTFTIDDNVYPSKPVVAPKTFNGTCVNSGSNVTYSICFDNTSNPALALTNTKIEYALGYSTFVSATDLGSYDPITNKVMWNIGNVAANAPQKCVSVVANTTSSSMHQLSIWSDQSFPAYRAEDIPLCAASADRPPVILSATPPTMATELVPYVHTVIASDPDLDPLTYSLDTYPTGMTINSTTGAISWTPAIGQAGVVSGVIRVSDGTLSVTQPFTISVTAANLPPTITSSPVTTGTEGLLYTYQIVAVDPEKGKMYYGLESGPVGMTVNSAGLVSWTPAPGSAGIHPVTVAVRDTNPDNLTVQSFTITVAPGKSPNNPPTFTSTPVINGTENVAYTYQVVAVDTDAGDTVGYSLINAPAGMVINTTTGLITWTPSYSQAGLYSVTVAATDSQGLTVQQNYSLSIANVNRLPVFTSTPVTAVAINNAYSYQAVATDPDLEAIVGYGLSVFPTGMSINTATGQISWTPTAAGAFNVTVTATDSVGGVGTQSFTIIVNDPGNATNRLPTITSVAPTAPVDEGSSYMYKVVATDPDNDVLTYSLAAGYPSGLLINRTTGLITWLPNYQSVGIWNVTVIVSDGRGGTAQQAFKITVNNIPPIFTSTPVLTGNDVVTYQYSATATDIGDAPVVLSLVNPPAGMAINWQGIISWANAVVGKYTITVAASDGYATTNQVYTLTITHINSPPVITSGAPLVATNEGTTFTYDVNATDKDGDVITYSLAAGAPAGMTIDKTTGIITWPTTYANIGTTSATVNATDGSLVASQTFSVTIANLAPVFKTVPVITASVGTAYTYSALATDAGGATVTYSVVTTATGLTINQTTGVVTWANPVAGSYSVTISASDGKTTSNQAYNLSVGAANVPPQVTSAAPTAPVNEGSLFSYAFTAIDGNNDLLTYSLVTAPATMSVNSQTGLITWTPMALNVGTATVTAKVDDGRGGSAQQTFTITVTNVAPSFTSTPITTWTVGTAYSYTATATDLGNAPITFTLGAGPAGMSIANGVVSWASPVAGTYTVTINASDGFLVTPQTYALTVNPPAGTNVAPVISTTAPTAPVAEGSVYTYDVNATDANGDILTYSLVAGYPAGMTINPSSGVISWTPTYTQAGTYSVTVRATDPGTLFASQTFSITVTNTDRPPVITSTPVNTATEGFSYSYQVVASDPDGDALTYSLTTAPAGMTISATGTVGWSPTAAQAGANTVTISVKGATAAAVQTYTVTVTTIAHLPVITSTPVTTATAGSPYAYQVVATDVDAGTTITYSIQGSTLNPLPAGMAINAATGLVTWTPTTAGTYSDITVVATDNTGLAGSQTFSIIVATGGNVAPVITSPAVTTATVGQPYSYQVVASDANGNPLTYSLTTKPAGMTISSTGLITWTPSTTGTNAVTVNVSDGTLSTNQSYTLTVAAPANQPPTIGSSPVITATATLSYSYQVVASDPEGAALTYTLTTKPAGMVITTAGLITWTPSTPGVYTVTVTVSDGLLTATQTYTVTVAPAPNDPPTISSTPVTTGTAGQAYSYQVAASDPEGSALTYGLTASPAGMTISTTGLVSWTPSAAGSYAVTVSVSDGVLSTPQSYTLTITGATNRAPSITSTAVTTATENTAYSYTVTATDPDAGDSVTFSLPVAPTGMTINSTTGVISWTPSYTQSGNQNVTVRANDKAGLTAEQSFTITVANVDRMPTITSNAVTTGTQNVAYSYQVVASDPDGDAIAYALTAPPAGMSISTNGLISWTPSAAGTFTVTVTATANGKTATQTYTVTVTAQANVAPAITSTPVTTATENAAYTYTVVATDANPGDLLTFSLPIAPAGMTINAATGVVSWKPSFTQSGSQAVTVRVADKAGLFADQSFTIIVANVNQVPVFTSTPITTATVNVTYTYTAVAVDPDGTAVTYSLTGRVPKGMTINATTGVVSWKPTSTGTSSVSIRVSDGTATATQTFSIVVGTATVNRAPSVTSTAVTTANENVAYTYTVTATDPDAGDSVTFSLPVAPAGMTINSTTGAISWTPTYSQSGNHNVTVRATDKGGLTADQSFTIVVTNIDRAPTITSTAVTAATQNVAYSYQVVATDPDGDAITYALATPPTGMIISATGLINWTPSAAGTFNVTVTATANAKTASQTYTITVTALANRAPSVTSTAITTATENVAYTYTATATDPDAGDSVTFGLPVAPAGMTINSTTGVISWTPTYTQSGNQAVTVRVTDKAGLTADQSFTIVVANVDRAPTITSAAVTTATEGSPYSYLVAASDPDGDAIMFSLTVLPAGMTINGTTGLINWNPSATGTFNVTVTATANGQTGTQSFTITVAAPANRAPSITSTAVTTATENAAYTYTVIATDPDAGDSVTFSLPAAPAGMTINGTTGVISWTPSYTQSGNQNVTVRATDKAGLAADQSFTIAVANVDRAPSITSTPVTTATQNVAYSYQVTAGDLDGDVITYALTTPPAGMTVSATGLISWTPATAGAFTVTVTATANGQTATQSFTVTVAAVAVDNPPVINSAAPTAAVAGVPYTYQVVATDPEGKALTYSLTTTQAGMTINSTTGLISWTPTTSQTGARSVAVRVSDGILTASQNFTIDVASNQSPTITSTAKTTATVNRAYTYQVTATDPEGRALTYSLTTRPSGMTISSTTGLISWTPTSTGSYSVTVSVADGISTARTQSYTLSVVSNTAPTFTSTAVTSAVVNRLYSYQVTATDTNGDTIAYSLTTRPTGMTINSTTGLITWTPTATGSYSVTVSASDGSASRTQSYTLSVVSNSTPTITSTAVTAAVVNTPYSYDVNATDANNDTLTYSLTTAPAGMTIDPDTGVISWTPTAAGSYSVTVSVTDGTASRTQSFAINVTLTANQAPVITSTAPTAAVAGVPYSYQVIADDPDGSTLTYSLTTTQTGMTINAATGLISWTPTTSQTGARSVTVRVSDGSLTASQSFTINVASNQSPTITSTAVTTATVSRAYTYQVVATDPEARPLTYSLTTRPSGMTINSTTGLISWTPASTGSYSVTVSVTDGVSTARTQSYTVSVISNQAPVISSTAPTLALVNQPYTYQVIATDANGDALTYSLPTARSGMTISPTGLITWTPTSTSQGGSVSVRVSDGTTSTSQSYTVTVRSSNSAPVITTTSLPSATAGSSYSRTLTATDSNGDALRWSLTAAPAGMTISTSGTISWRPTTAQRGTHTVTAAVTDSLAITTKTFSLTVN